MSAAFRSKSICVLASVALASFAPLALAANTKNILLTGYWPPTNEMVRPFSANPTLNPAGWIGQNWEARGYNVYAYFPTFAVPTCTSCGQGSGDFEVDYQDTSSDFWSIVATLQPVAIVTCSRTSGNFVWQVELNAINYTAWTNDYTAPLQPTPSPPDSTVAGGFTRQSTLPMQAIVDAVNAVPLGITASIDPTNSGNFLSGYMAYHGMWYQSIHAAANDPARCVAAGHIHVGDAITWSNAHEATKISLREVLDHVDSILASPGDVNLDGTVNVTDLLLVIGQWGPCPVQPSGCTADLNNDDQVNVTDLLEVIGNWD